MTELKALKTELVCFALGAKLSNKPRAVNSATDQMC